MTGAPPARRENQRQNVSRELLLMQRNVAWAIRRSVEQLCVPVATQEIDFIAAAVARSALALPYARRRTTREIINGRRAELTLQQRRALIGVAHGMTAQEIGDRVGLSVDTIKTHLKNTYVALGAKNAAHAVATALRTGVIAHDDLDMYMDD